VLGHKKRLGKTSRKNAKDASRFMGFQIKERVKQGVRLKEKN
jgi:hypothetical protein